MKKFLSLFICVLIILSSFTIFNVSAKESNIQNVGDIYGGTIGECSWNYDTGTNTLTISGNGTMDITPYLDDSGNVVIAPWDNYRDEIKKVVIKNGVKNIGLFAFAACKMLTDVVIPNSITKIEYCAFSLCENLTKVSIPASVTEIEGSVFEGCSKLTSITITKNVSSIGDNVFSNCNKLSNIKVDSKNKHFTSYGGNLYNKSRTTLYSYAIGRKGKSFSVPSSVKSICPGAFCGSNYLTNVILPNKISSIENRTFYYCSKLSSITIPNTVKTIETEAFYSCVNLKNIYYKGLNSQWKKIKIGSGNDYLKKAKLHIIIESQTISAKSFTKYYGDKSFSLGAKAKTKLTYKSSNNSVATVSSNGKVTIKGIGKATITISAVSNSKYKSATKKITVNVKLKPVNIKSIKVKKLSGNSLKVYWSKVSNINGYQINIATSNINNGRKQNKTNVVLNRARKGLKIKFSVRTYKKIGKKSFYSDWTVRNIVFK